MTRRGREVVVVGGGVFGLGAAIELRRRGHGVHVLDPGPLPCPQASSTDISKAVRLDYGCDELYTALADRAIRGWREWNRAWPRPLFHETGFLLLTRRAIAPGSYESNSLELLARLGHPLERLDPERLARIAPAWDARSFPDGYFNPRGGWVESANVVAQLAATALALGVRVSESVRVERFAERGSRVCGVMTERGVEISAERVLVAAGAWTTSLVPELAPVMWASGQPVLQFRPTDPEPYRGCRFPVWAADISTSGWYGFPANADGVVKIANHGKGRRMNADDPRSVDPEWEGRAREFLDRSLPGLARAPLAGARLCLYCDTMDGDFLIDRDPRREGVVVAAGGSGHGFKFAPVLGPIVADVLEDRPAGRPARFAWRTPERRSTEEARSPSD